jgi:hypothetical protein
MRMRRERLGQLRDTLAAILAQHDSMLGKTPGGGGGFTKERKRLGRLEALGDHFGKDRPAFNKIMTRAYIAGQGTHSDVQ